MARNGRFVRAQITRAGMVLAAVAGLAAAGLPVLPAGANGVGTVYVANEGSGSVSVIEHVGNTVRWSCASWGCRYAGRTYRVRGEQWERDSLGD